MALARQLAQYDYEQRRKQHQSILHQQHIRNGQILHALEQNLAVIDAKARELRSKGIRDKELDVLLTEARWKRDQARAAALAGLEEHGRALDDPCHADQQQPQLGATSTSIQPSFLSHCSPCSSHPSRFCGRVPGARWAIPRAIPRATTATATATRQWHDILHFTRAPFCNCNENSR